MMITLWIGGFLSSVYAFIGSVWPNYSMIPCIGDVWINGILLPVFAGSLFLRCFQLLVVFNLAKHSLKKLNREGDSDEQIGVIKKRLYENSQWVSERRLLWMFFILTISFQIFPLMTTIYGYLTYGTVLGHDEICSSLVRTSGSFIFFVVMIGSYIVIGIQLRKVHDAYFLKQELKLILLFMIPPGFASIILASLPFHTGYQLVSDLLIYLAYGIISYMLPACLAFRNSPPKWLLRLFPKMKNSRNSGTTNSGSEASGTETDAQISSKSRPTMAELIDDRVGLQFVEEFLVHYQLLRMSRCLILYFDIKRFKTTQGQTALVSKAYIIFQKYLKPNSYLFVDCLGEEQRTRYEKMITDAMNYQMEENKEGEPVQISADIFDDLLRILEDEMQDGWYKHFLKSRYYLNYAEKQTLKQGIDISSKSPV